VGSVSVEPVLIPSPTVDGAPTPDLLIIETMSDVSVWSVFTDGQSSYDISSVPGRTDSAIKIAYDLAPGGWVGISKELDPGLLSRTNKIQFYYYKVSGLPNTLELKLLYKPDSSGTGPVFSVSRREVANMGDWVLFEAAYDAFACGDTCPAPGARLDAAQVWKMDIAVSHQLGGSSGKGEVIIDDVQAVR